jgi:hypothetical protein
MSLMTILAAAQNGNYFANVAKACGLGAGEAKSALSSICPAIAERLRAKAESDHDSFEALLDLLDDGGGSSDLDDAEAVTGAEAISDGNAVLKDIYGSSAAALAEMKKLAPSLDGAPLQNVSAIGATSVLAALAKTYSAPATLVDAPQAASGSGGLMGTIFSAVVAGVVQGVVKQLAPKRRRRRSYSGYFGTRRKPVRRRRARTPSLNDIFGQILGNRK